MSNGQGLENSLWKLYRSIFPVESNFSSRNIVDRLRGRRFNVFKREIRLYRGLRHNQDSRGYPWNRSVHVEDCIISRTIFLLSASVNEVACGGIDSSYSPPPIVQFLLIIVYERSAALVRLFLATCALLMAGRIHYLLG